jgi:hypothetical protein
MLAGVVNPASAELSHLTTLPVKPLAIISAGVPPIQIAWLPLSDPAFEAGETVTVIVYAELVQLPATAVAVTMYCTVPALVLLGLVNIWLMVLPDPGLAPVMLPVIAPMVQVVVLAALVVNEILVAVPVQIVLVLAVVTAGWGFTVTVIT